MIKLSDDASQEAFKDSFVVGHRLAKEITELFPPEVVLEFEKTYYPYCQWMQKVYAGILFEKQTDKGAVKCKGVASVKNDTIGVVRDWTNQIITLFLKHDQVGAKRYLIEQLTKFVKEPVDGHAVAKTVKMSKEIDMYANANEVASVAAAMTERDPGSAPSAGDKVTFLHCLDKQNRYKALPLDIDYYESNKERFEINKMHYLTKLITESVGKLFDLPTVAADPYQWFKPFERALLVQKNGSGIAQFMRTKNASGDDDGGESAEREEFPMRLFRDSPYAKESVIKRNRVNKAEKKHFEDECRRLAVSKKEMKNKQAKRKHGLPMSQFFKVRKINTAATPTAEAAKSNANNNDKE